MEMPKPQKEHEWLRQLAGEWTMEVESTFGPDKPVEKALGSESACMFGDLWLLSEGIVDEGEQTMKSLLTLGYDPQKGCFIGTFISSTMTMLWQYEGSLDASGRVLTLDTTGPNIAVEGQMAKYQDIHEIINPDHRTITGQMLGEDGQWHKFMTAHYHRKK